MVYLKRPHLHYPLMRVDQVLRETAERCDKPAFLHPIKLTYEELDARVDGFAFKLRELGMGVGMGMGRGSR